MSSYIFNPSQTAGKSVDLAYLQANYPSKSYLAVVVGGLATNASVSSATTDTVINQKLLTGYAPSAGGVVSSTDTIRSAIGKLANNTLPASIIANPLTGFSSTTGIVSASDSILSAVSKLTGNASALSASTVSLTGTQTLTGKTFGDSLTANAGVVVKGTSNQIKMYPATDNSETSLALYNLTSGAGVGWIVGQNIFSVGTGVFGIGGGTTGVVLKADPTSGLITLPKSLSCGGDLSVSGVVNITKNITFPIADIRKRIAIFDDGIPSDQTDHRFNGFGKGAYQQVYQVKTTAENHVFYSATSATTSNELFRIAGTGAVSCAGTLASGSHTITGALTATTTANITGLATVGSLASTGNATVGGTLGVSGLLTVGGGASFTGAITVATGGITCQNGVSCSVLTTPYITFPSGTLSYYEEFDHITAFNISGITSLNLTIRFTRVGRQVSAHVPAVSMTNSATLTSAPALSSTVAFPTRFRSANNCYCFVPVNNDSLSPVSSVGCANITSSGIFEVHPTNAVSVFSINGAYNFGFSSFTATWSV